MAYELTKQLETGNKQIDTEHRQLLNAVNSLLDSCNSGKGRGEVEKTISFLVSYTKTHFAHEEELQKKYKYPDYLNHKKEHRDFINVVNEIQQEYRRNGATIVLVGQVNKNIVNWILTHINKEDTKVANHIKNYNKQG